MTSTIAETALALSRWVELSILGKATIMLALGLTVTRMAVRAPASVRHLLLVSTFATLLALPLIVLTAPAMTIEIPVSHAGDLITASRVTPPSDALTPPTSYSLGYGTPDSGHW